MAGFMDFTDGAVLTGDQIDEFLMRQAIPRFPTTAALLLALPVGIRAVGMMAWADDTEICYGWSGSSWVPLWSPWKSSAIAMTAGGTGITFGNSTTVQRYRYSGGMVDFFWKMTVGSTANMQSGNYAWGLPVSTHADSNHAVIGSIIAFDTSASAWFSRDIVTVGSQGSCAAQTEAGVRLATSTPFGVATGDIYCMNLRYQPTAAAELT